MVIKYGHSVARPPENPDTRKKKLSRQCLSAFTALTSILEPVLILFMGAVVLLIVLPIIQMNQMVK